MQIVLRGAADPAGLRAAVRRLNPNLAVSNIAQMDQIAGGSFATHRFSLLLVALFAAVALALAATGIYGVISYAVSQRMHEFGMRLALGARPSDLMTLVLGQGLKLAIAGILVGLAASLSLTRILRTILYEAGAFDALTFAAVAAMAAVTAAVACYLPARRATQADPMTALRSE
jgi:ABC-type antimicrobial peptide transport system permease subunit